MDFKLQKKHLVAQELFRDFATKEVEPFAQEIDLTHEFPYGAVEKMHKLGFLGIPYDRKYGGQGCDTLTYVLAIEEISKKCASTGVILSAHTSLGAGPINQYGTEEQKEKFLRPLVSGEKLGAFGLTEPEAGTDAGSQQTTAVLDGNDYIINGSKIFITNAGPADIYVIFAMTDKAARTRGITAFIVEKGTEGFGFGKAEDKMGIHGSSTEELIFNNCRIPKENILGKVGEGYKIALGTLDGGRIGIAAQALGIAQGALDKTVAYVNERKQFGRPLAAFQNTQFELAGMATEIEAARYLVYRAALTKDADEDYGYPAAMAKLKASKTAMEVTTKAVQLHGGYGYMREYDVERMMRDAKITEIYEGTSEVMRMVIAAKLLS